MKRLKTTLCRLAAMLVVISSGQVWAAPPTELDGTLTLTDRVASTGYEAWDFTYTEAGWATELFGVIVKPEGAGLMPGVVAAHGKGGNSAGFGVQKAEGWFGPENFIVIAPELTHAGQVFCLDSDNQCGGSAENVRRVRRATEILTSQQLIDALGEVVNRDNIFLYGNSLGSLAIIEAAGDLGARIRAVAVSAGGVIENGKLAYMSPSGTEIARDIHAPVIHMHGRLDRVINPSAEQAFSDALESYNREHQLIWFPDAGHNIARGQLTEGLVAQFTIDWFNTYLQHTEPQIDSIDPASGFESTWVTLVGQRLGDNADGYSKVLFNGVEASDTDWFDSEVDAVVPLGATTGGVTVVVPVGPTQDPQLESPVIGGVHSNRVNFTVLQ